MPNYNSDSFLRFKTETATITISNPLSTLPQGEQKYIKKPNIFNLHKNIST